MYLGIMLSSFVVSVVCAALCWLLAERKGRHGAVWAVLGFVAWFIPLIVLAILKPSEPQGPPAPTSSSEF